MPFNTRRKTPKGQTYKLWWSATSPMPNITWFIYLYQREVVECNLPNAKHHMVHIFISERSGGVQPPQCQTSHGSYIYIREKWWSATSPMPNITWFIYLYQREVVESNLPNAKHHMVHIFISERSGGEQPPQCQTSHGSYIYIREKTEQYTWNHSGKENNIVGVYTLQWRCQLHFWLVCISLERHRMHS